jgi:hypothetical protein
LVKVEEEGWTTWTIEHVGGSEYAFKQSAYLTAEPSGMMFHNRTPAGPGRPSR